MKVADLQNLLRSVGEVLAASGARGAAVDVEYVVARPEYALSLGEQPSRPIERMP
jgi:hypothetical protein